MKFFDKMFGKKNDSPNSIKNVNLKEIEYLINDNIKKNSKWVSEFRESFNILLEDLKISSNSLKKVSFEEEVDIRVEDRVKDNIDNYINKINIMIDRLNKINFDFLKLKDLINEYDKEISKFNKETIKNYYLIQIVFKNDVSKVGKSLKDLDNLFKDIKNKISQEEYVEYLNINENFNNLNKCKSKLDSMNQRLFEKRNEYGDIIKEIEDNNGLIEDINKSSEYIKYKKLEVDRQNFINEIESLKGSILNKFQFLDKGLKKLNRLSPSKMLLKYCETSLSLLEDQNLEIFEYINILREKIIVGEIDLEDKNKKVIEFIDDLKKSDIIKIKDKYSELISKINDIDNKLSESIILNKILDYSYKINSLKIKSDRLQIEIASFDDSQMKIDYNNLKFDIEEEYYKLFLEKIIIESYVYS